MSFAVLQGTAETLADRLNGAVLLGPVPAAGLPLGGLTFIAAVPTSPVTLTFSGSVGDLLRVPQLVAEIVGTHTALRAETRRDPFGVSYIAVSSDNGFTVDKAGTANTLLGLSASVDTVSSGTVDRTRIRGFSRGATEGHYSLVIADTAAPPVDAGTGEALSVANIAALSGVVSLIDGQEAYVRSVRDRWVSSNRASPPATDGITVVAHSNGGAWRWERLCIAHPSWSKVVDWGIDPVSGSDEAVGTAASPLKTSYELQRRIGMWGQLAPQCVIQLLTDFPFNASFRLSATVPEDTTGGATASAFHMLTIRGARAQLATGTLTATGPASAFYTPLTRVGAGARNIIYASGTDFSGYVDKYVRLVDGPAAGYGAWIQVGANGSAQLTPWCLEHTNDLTTPAAPAVLQPGGIAAGHTFEILNMTSLGGSPLLRLQGGGSANVSTQRVAATSVQLRWVRSPEHSEVNFAFTFGNIETGYGIALFLLQTDLHSSIVATQAREHGCLVGGGIFTTGYIGNAIRFYAGGGRARTPVAPQFSIGGGNVYFDGDFCFTSPLFVGVAGSTADNYAAAVRIGTAFFAVTGDAITVGMHGCCEVRIGEYGTASAYGTATARGVRIMSGGKLFYTAKPTINDGLGAAREAIVGGTDRLYAQVPYIEGTNLACFAVSAT